MYKKNVVVIRINELMQRADNILIHLLFLFLNIRTDTNVETKKDERIIMKSNIAPSIIVF